MARSRPESGIFGTLTVLAAVLVAGCIFVVPAVNVQMSPWVIGLLIACALIAELMPVRLGQSAFRITVALPFLAVLAFLTPSWVVVSAEAGIQLVAAALLTAFLRVRTQRPLLIANLLLTVCMAAGAAWTANALARPDPFIYIAAFEAAYIALNLIGLAVLSRASARPTDRASRALPGVAFLALLTAFQFTLAAGLMVVVWSNSWWALPLALYPVFLLRLALARRAAAEDQYHETIVALMLMLQRAHPYTHGHLERVSRLAERVALRLGLGAKRARMVRDAAILHDVGKIAIDERILDKPAKLTAEEMDHVRKHSAFGAEILAPCRHFRDMVPWIRHHHERIDGNGYPDRLPDQKIPIESKIIAVTDAFDAMVGSGAAGGRRTYRDPMDVPSALAELQACSGTQFDSAVVSAFEETVLEGGL